MGKIFKNIILMLLLFTIIILMIGILFYDYLPTRVEIQEANEYEPDQKVIKLLATIKKEKEELFGITSDSPKEEVVIQAYNLDAHDLAVYEQADSYVSGKVNPFADLPKLDENGNAIVDTGNNSSTGSTNNSGTNNKPNTNTTNKPSGGTSGNNINTNTLTEVKDNTILNSGNSK